MKKIFLLFFLIAVISFKYSERFINKNTLKKNLVIPKPMQGDNDNPYAAQEFRYNMLKGNKPYLDPLARQRAVSYTKKYLLKKEFIMISKNVKHGKLLL